jgi:hypothetical protein
MYRFYLLVLLLSINDCVIESGDIFQNLLDDERIEIILSGTCLEVEKGIQSAYNSVVESASEKGIEGEELFAIMNVAGIPTPVYDEENQGEDCVSYRDNIYVSDFERRVNIIMIRESTFICDNQRRWKKLN